MSAPGAAVAALVEDLVAANRILAHYGVLDGFGHVSARHPERPDRFLLSCSRAPELVAAADIMEFDLDSGAQGGDTRKPYLERFIHGEIYRTRPDVKAIVHSHSPSVIPFAASSVKLRPVYHMGSFLSAGGAPVFDIQECARKTGFQTMRYDGLKKVLRGMTTLEEVDRVTMADEDMYVG